MSAPNVPVVMGIDPGYGRTGYAIVTMKDQKAVLLDCGCITTPSTKSFDSRLVDVHQALQDIITKWRPQRAGVEQVFFSTNVKTAIDVGQARGVILLTLSQNFVPIVHVNPMEVKQSLTGYGQADKAQVQKMVQVLLGLASPPQPDDAADAAAIALYTLHWKPLPGSVASIESKA